MKQWMTALLLAATMWVNPAVAEANWQEASEVVDAATRDMLALMGREELTQEENTELLMQEIETIISPVVDFPYIAKHVMGKYYRRASDAERERFADVFKTTLLRTYAKSIAGFDLKEYSIQSPTAESPEPEKQVISVDVSSGNGEIYTLVYYMLKQEQRWTLVNVMVDGINLRITFRNQFADLYQQNRTIAATIDAWAIKMQDVKLEKTGSEDDSSEG
ncbi:MlaC/ttg2D family ABC transporter substrate-binding protein [Marinobacterium sediminicola]|uniref:Phospholipid transport system substrate-binding protein n=1 Tax=Marinobacterium sediminicola TaxID=518898 RepID=A0ABY1RY38_9GAMM|nr:ABC transporter substrate-binding protein [Marinobacterium sediminicola]ULG68668.1 ABC transporter substrate-binding protein [Marinobacterium sediminicola]SMR73191.1 phospholipid transport system substrate-binding protein [Marinobacterium sediminicola]